MKRITVVVDKDKLTPEQDKQWGELLSSGMQSGAAVYLIQGECIREDRLDINDRVNENQYRCDGIYPLFGFTEGSLRGSPFGTIFSDYNEQLNTALGLDEDFFDKYGSDSQTLCDELECWLYDNKKQGYVAIFAKPIISNYKDDGYTATWGYYQTQWFYAKTIDGLFKKADEWAEELLEFAKFQASKETEQQTL